MEMLLSLKYERSYIRMKNYELTYLISSELQEEEAKQLQGKIISFMQEDEGILVKENWPFRKKLAYPVKKQSQAYLAVLEFQLEPEKLANLEKKLKLENQILRYLMLFKPPVKKTEITSLTRKSIVITEKLEKEKKVELKEIEKKLEEILNEPQ